MSIGAASSAISQAASSVEQSVQVTKHAQDQQKRDGEAAVSLIRAADSAGPSASSSHKVDTYA